MTRYALLLRGVNVGGHRKLAMPDLSAVLTCLGHTDVATYLQSGNAVLTATRTTPAKLAAGVEEALAAELGLTTRVLVRTHADLAALVAANPFPDAAAENPAWLHVAFLAAVPDANAAAALDAAALAPKGCAPKGCAPKGCAPKGCAPKGCAPKGCAPDEFALGDHAIYLRYATSPGRSKLAAIVGKAVLAGAKDPTATARNWNTVRALTERTSA